MSNDVSKMIIGVSFVLLLLLPLIALISRRMNYSLLCFYAILSLEVMADLSGNGLLLRVAPLNAIVFGIWAFAVASSLEYVVRGNYLLAALCAFVLLLFGGACYIAAAHGAFA